MYGNQHDGLSHFLSASCILPLFSLFSCSSLSFAHFFSIVLFCVFCLGVGGWGDVEEKTQKETNCCCGCSPEFLGTQTPQPKRQKVLYFVFCLLSLAFPCWLVVHVICCCIGKTRSHNAPSKKHCCKHATESMRAIAILMGLTTGCAQQ